MRRIIKQGKKPKTYRIIYKTTCPNCKCIFEFEGEDITGEKRINGSKSVICPCCNHTIVLYTGDHGEAGNYTERKEEIKESEPIIVPSPTIPFNPHPDYDPWRYPDYSDPFDDWMHKYTPPKDPCDTCPHKDGPKDGLGNPTVGDSPCQWCPHYKYKVVYCCNANGMSDINTTVTSYIKEEK